MQPSNESSFQIISESSSQDAQESIFLVIRLITCFAGLAVLLTGLGFVIVSIKEIYQAVINPETATPIISQWVEYFNSGGLMMNGQDMLIPAEVVATGLLFIVGFLLASISLKLLVSGAKIISHASVGKAAISKMVDEAVKRQLKAQGRSQY